MSVQMTCILIIRMTYDAMHCKTLIKFYHTTKLMISYFEPISYTKELDGLLFVQSQVLKCPVGISHVNIYVGCHVTGICYAIYYLSGLCDAIIKVQWLIDMEPEYIALTLLVVLYCMYTSSNHFGLYTCSERETGRQRDI